MDEIDGTVSTGSLLLTTKKYATLTLQHMSLIKKKTSHYTHPNIFPLYIYILSKHNNLL